MTDEPEAADPTAPQAPAAPRLIKKYANRRLYDTGTSAYITLDSLAAMIREGIDFRVIDAKSGDDLTHGVLAQIIMEEGQGTAMLPAGVMRQLIALYGGGMGGAVSPYLEAAMDAFSKNGQAWRQAMSVPFQATGWEEIARRQMDLMTGRAWAGAKSPEPTGPGPSTGPNTGEEAHDIDDLKRRLDALQAEVERLRR